jgi:hypothetical protein
MSFPIDDRCILKLDRLEHGLALLLLIHFFCGFSDASKVTGCDSELSFLKPGS